MNFGAAKWNTNIGEMSQKQIMKVYVNGTLRPLTNNQFKDVLQLDDVIMNEVPIKHHKASLMYSNFTQRLTIKVNKVIYNR